MEENKLLPCPFCGNESVISKDSGNENYGQSWKCGCDHCAIYTPRYWGSSSWRVDKRLDKKAENAAIDHWNNRA